MGFFNSKKGVSKGNADEKVYEAAETGDIKLLHKYLSAGACVVNAVKVELGWTALHAAASKQHSDCLQALLEAKDGKALLDKFDHDKVTALHLAASRGNVECVNILLKHGADSNMRTKEDGWTALHSAVLFGHEAAAQALLQGGAETNALSNDGLSALHLAAGWGNAACIELLLESGADINIVDKMGESAADRALQREQGDTVQLLVDRGCVKCKIIEEYLETFKITPKPSKGALVANGNTEAHDLIAKYPNKVPVILTKSPCGLPDTKQAKFLTPNTLTVAAFISQIVKKSAGIPEDTEVFVNAGKTTLNSAMGLASVYKQYHDASGFLYLTYSSTPIVSKVTTKIATFEHKSGIS
mmetsp:Transcript_29239/g.40399  ORF Transcript_29239/g.40399 Transcript_29239/m.40399 type:complete len:357 (-) Transcript_29239:174-1244(-)